MSRAGLPVLTYHAIGAGRSATETDRSWFAETLAALSEAGYRAVDLDDWIARGRPDLPRAFALVFDDGLRSILGVADLVADHRVPATVFLVTGRVGLDNAWEGRRAGVPTERLLDWSEIADLDGLGFRFSAHGESHARLDRLDGDRLDRELRGSRDTIEDRLGRPCRLLAYPYGASTPRVRRRAAVYYTAAFGTALGHSDADQNPFDLARIDAHYLRSRRALGSLLEGRARGWLRRRRALRAVRRLAGPLLAVGRPR